MPIDGILHVDDEARACGRHSSSSLLWRQEQQLGLATEPCMLTALQGLGAGNDQQPEQAHQLGLARGHEVVQGLGAGVSKQPVLAAGAPARTRARA